LSERIIKHARVGDRPVMMCGEDLRRLLEAHGRVSGRYADATAIERDVTAIIAAARDAATRIEAEARSRGYEAGLAEGREKASAEIRAESGPLREQAERLLREAEERARLMERDAAIRAAALLADARREYERILAEAEPAVVRLALCIARKIVARELKEHPEDSVIALAREALAQAATNEEVSLKVHPDDLEAVRARQGELLQGSDPSLNVRVEPDASVPRGNCIAQTSLGTIDARVETQFEELSRELGVDDTQQEHVP